MKMRVNKNIPQEKWYFHLSGRVVNVANEKVCGIYIPEDNKISNPKLLTPVYVFLIRPKELRYFAKILIDNDFKFGYSTLKI